ncbi:MAG: hypothetical protein ACRECH_17005, partial [Nitrososphaerales archaeon]
YLLGWIDKDANAASLFQRDPRMADAFSAASKLLSNPKEVETMGLSKAISSEIERGFSINDGLSAIRTKGKSKAWLKTRVVSLVSSEREFEAKHSPEN